ncbi:MAG TPA: O-antigen ligase family protein [Thermoleophilaceae bacterium]|jgi:hypothetical protein
MVARRRLLGDWSGGDARFAATASVVTVLLTLAAFQKFGAKGLFFPVLAALAIVMLMRPVVAIYTTVLLTLLAEGGDFGLFRFASHIYNHAYKNLTAMDFVVIIALVSVAIDLVRNRRPVRVPRPLVLPLTFLALGMLAGVVVGHQNGAGIRTVVLSENALAFLLLLPIAVTSLDLDRRSIDRLLRAMLLLAGFKAVLGIIEIAAGLGETVEGQTRLTYYEPAPNWLISVAILTVFAGVVMRIKPPRWMLLSFPLLFACLLLSYRRSFWIGIVLALLLVLLLGLAPIGRRLLLPASLAVALAIWLLSSVHFQAQSPVTRRFTSLDPTSLQANLEDRYRLDERANVLGEIKQYPIEGLGMTIPWAATTRPLPVEHADGRQYVHFALLWFWLKLGILGLLAYVSIIIGSMVLAFEVWRRNREGLFRAFGLASLCGIVALVVCDTTASFTGVDERFTIVFGVQLGVLGLLARLPASEPEPLPGE